MLAGPVPAVNTDDPALPATCKSRTNRRAAAFGWNKDTVRSLLLLLSTLLAILPPRPVSKRSYGAGPIVDNRTEALRGHLT
jgi:hypothetical protein